jgi:P27 family predicted phage terminase small subunit
MRGRKPTPIPLRLLRGNPGKRNLHLDEQPKPADIALDEPPPMWLDEDGVREWRRLAPKLRRLKLLTEIDGDALALYCQCYAQWKQATAKLREFGTVIKGKGGFPVMSPYVPVANRAMAQMKAFLIEFGMTPSSRSRVRTAQDSAAGDPFAEFDRPLPVKVPKIGR